MNRLRSTRSIIPNLFTAMNMFAGFLSILNTGQGKYFDAAWLIIAAAIFDALDGFVARLTKSSSQLGVELDSLSDIVSFGAAPAFLIYSAFLANFEIWGMLISSLLVISGGFRLARFNVQLKGFDKEFFSGLPIPSSAITTAAFVLAYYETGAGLQQTYSYYAIPLVIVLSILMVSKIKYDTIPKPSLKELKSKPFHFLFLLLTVVVLFATKGEALFYIFLFIVLFGIFRHIYYKIVKKKSNQKVV